MTPRVGNRVDAENVLSAKSRTLLFQSAAACAGADRSRAGLADIDFVVRRFTL